MADESFHERTEPATPRRRRQAREEGRVARSQELNSALALLAGMGLLSLAGPFMLTRLMAAMRWLLSGSGDFDLSADMLGTYLRAGLPFVLLTLLPVAGGLCAVGVLANLAQVGLVLSWKPLAPKLDALSPAKGFARIFSKQSGVELVKSLLKIVVIGWIAWVTVRAEIPRFAGLMGADPGALFECAAAAALRLGLRVALVMVVLAAADYAFQRWDYERGIMMSHREVEEELRETEGDPRVRARVRAVQREMARRRMMQKVKTADVVVTNPTHLAVALRYERRTMKAPRVVAKGERLVALKIRELAARHRVPVLEDRPLARALFQVELEHEIPVALYRAVAELLAYVYRLKQRPQTALA